jgi:hypothetical protein
MGSLQSPSHSSSPGVSGRPMSGACEALDVMTTTAISAPGRSMGGPDKPGHDGPSEWGNKTMGVSR